MNGLLEQLTSRSLDSMPLAVRPRQLSRFESKAQPEIGTEVEAESVSAIAHDQSLRDDQPVRPIQAMHHDSIEQPYFERRMVQDIAMSPITEQRQRDVVQTQDAAPVVPRFASQESNHDRTDMLLRRLAQIDRQLQSLAPRDELSRPLTQPVPKLSVEPVETISREETHHHYQHHAEHNYYSQSIEQSNERTVLAPPSENRASRERTPPNIVAGDKPMRKPRIEEQGVMPHLVQPRIESNDQIPPPQVIVKPVVHASPGEWSQRAERPSSVPQIVVEKHIASDPASHTVTVTIGRIEVRAPQKPAAPAIDKAKRPAARIMSLDDYMRRRAGGAG